MPRWEVSTRSFASSTRPRSSKVMVEEPPNLKYPFSAPFSTRLPGVKVYSKLPTLVAPTSSMTTSAKPSDRSEEHTSELQSLRHLVCRLLLEKKKNKKQ